MARPRLLDLYCCAGGMGAGLAAAGFDVVGVDIRPQPNYLRCGAVDFVRADALDFLARHGREFDAIHASPPCQRFTSYRRCRPEKGDEHYPNLIPATREALAKLGKPYSIENVPGAPLGFSLLLCGSMFDPPLGVRRHRYFETSWLAWPPGPCRHGVWRERKYPGGRSKERHGDNRAPARFTVEVGTWDIPLETQRQAMGGCGWMTTAELSQAIPPAFGEWVGWQMMRQLEGR